MNSKQEKLLEKIFDHKLSKNIHWKEVESLFLAYGAEIYEGNGSRVRVLLNGVRAIFHRPHPNPEIHKGMLRSIKQFLQSANITPKSSK